MTVRVLTDSTAYLPEGFSQRLHIGVIPLQVLVDGSSLADGVELGPGELTEALRQKKKVTTSRPGPEEFAELFRAELDAGASEVVSVHLSRELSGTWESARLAAEQVGHVRVVDSRSTAMGLGFAAIAAAERATAGASGAEVEAAAAAAAAKTSTFFCVPTLDYLRRGGRIGTTRALLGTALAVKPLLHVEDGKIVPLEKVRTTGKALARLVELAADAADGGPAKVAVHHLTSQDRAVELADRLERRVRCVDGVVVSEVGAVIGAHTGPGVLGVVVLPSP